MSSPTSVNMRVASSGTPENKASEGMTEGQRKALFIGIGVGAVVLLVGVIAGAIYLSRNPTVAASWRDVFIILMALEFMLIGVAMVVLIFQLAVLTNMIQHEVKPILESTNETVNTVRGTTTFLSENLIDPVIKLNSYLAGITQVMNTLGVFGRSKRKK